MQSTAAQWLSQTRDLLIASPTSKPRLKDVTVKRIVSYARRIDSWNTLKLVAFSRVRSKTSDYECFSTLTKAMRSAVKYHSAIVSSVSAISCLLNTFFQVLTPGGLCEINIEGRWTFNEQKQNQTICEHIKTTWKRTDVEQRQYTFHVILFKQCCRHHHCRFTLNFINTLV